MSTRSDVFGVTPQTGRSAPSGETAPDRSGDRTRPAVDRALVVYANPEPRSFGAAVRDECISALQSQGMDVEVSDLYEMEFNPVARAEDFAVRRFPERLWYDREQQHNVRHGRLAEDVAAEAQKLERCDLLVLVFPLWWFSVPAILKGWFDRVLVKDIAYGSGRRYETGGYVGKRAQLITTTNAWPGMMAPDGLMGSVDVILWPLTNGVLAYTGFDVLHPLVAHAVGFVDEERRAAVLTQTRGRLAEWRTSPAMPFHRSDEVDGSWRLRPEVEPRVAGHRRTDAREGER